MSRFATVPATSVHWTCPSWALPFMRGSIRTVLSIAATFPGRFEISTKGFLTLRLYCTQAMVLSTTKAVGSGLSSPRLPCFVRLITAGNEAAYKAVLVKMPRVGATVPRSAAAPPFMTVACFALLRGPAGSRRAGATSADAPRKRKTSIIASILGRQADC